MKNKGIVIFATEEARKNYKKKEMKVKKIYCPSCEIGIAKTKYVQNLDNIIDKEIKEDILIN
jgi:hypothetical protein